LDPFIIIDVGINTNTPSITIKIEVKFNDKKLYEIKDVITITEIFDLIKICCTCCYAFFSTKPGLPYVPCFVRRMTKIVLHAMFLNNALAPNVTPARA
jgi:hypothetical protein